MHLYFNFLITCKLNEMNKKLGFIEQTAKDYDMPVWKVQQIYDNNPTTKFYDCLEEYIKERARANER